jgi:hypothetical protein
VLRCTQACDKLPCTVLCRRCGPGDRRVAISAPLSPSLSLSLSLQAGAILSAIQAQWTWSQRSGKPCEPSGTRRCRKTWLCCTATLRLPTLTSSLTNPIRTLYSAGAADLESEEWQALRAKWDAQMQEDLAVLHCRLEAAHADARTRLALANEHLGSAQGNPVARSTLMRVERTILCQVSRLVKAKSW